MEINSTLFWIIMLVGSIINLIEFYTNKDVK